MKLWITTAALGIFIVTGCGKKEAATPAVTPPSTPAPKAPAPGSGTTAVAPVAAPVDTGIPGSTPPPPPGGAPAPAAVDSGLPQMNFAEQQAKNAAGQDPQKILPNTDALNLLVNEFKVGYGRFPKDANELVQAKLLPRLPQLPAGKKFVVDQNNGQVTVANQ